MAKGLCNTHYTGQSRKVNRDRINARKRLLYQGPYGDSIRGAYDPLQRRANALWVKYRVTLEQFNMLEAIQNGLCAICSGEPTAVRGRGGVYYKTLHVDHNHETGQVRGLLCSRCNVALGSFQDSPENLASAIAYLKSWSKCHPAQGGAIE